MKEFDQEYLMLFDADGKQIQRGDCFRCCVAMVLSHFDPTVELSDVPHFFKEETGTWSAIDDFLRERGYVMRDYPMHTAKYPDNGHNPLALMHGHFDRQSPYILAGKSPRHPTIQHAVVMQGAWLWHDPHPDKDGIHSLSWIYVIEPVGYR